MGFLRWAVERAVNYAVAHPPATPQASDFRGVLELSSRINLAALGQAASAVDDEMAAAVLRDEVQDRGEAVRRSIEYLGDPRDNFLHDRAFRLLTSVVDGGRVRPIDSSVRDLFLAEEQLGRLPLGEAFESLARDEPRLLEVEREVAARRAEFAHDTSQQVMFEFIGNRVESLVGFSARGKGWLLRSDVTQAVVLRYLLAVAGARGEDAGRALFDRPGDCNRAILFWGLKRPAAHN